ncbi:beta-ketoacyl-[acyl-carrier-protein] synthase family protein [Carboxylicivirga sp. RSCT41]|uniref:beta-ketoacyl-[acyl-carrier-protein] synthase family protein n=1 Tax=Carboxylicivirga agarovorans TaxID=3417570 RepID=UPI003D34BE1A
MVRVTAHNIISPLGCTSQENFDRVVSGQTGIALQSRGELSDSDFQAALLDMEVLKDKISELTNAEEFTKLEQLCLLSLNEVLEGVDVKSDRTGFIFSTTKGNITEIEADSHSENALLATTANKIAAYFGFQSQAQVISNACISGLAAFVIARRYIDAGIYDNVVIVGADVLSKFIVSGFQSFQSLSAEPCKPFDGDRDGLTLGEAVASVVLSKTDAIANAGIEVVSGAISNDANHISGPSRTGEGLYRAITRTVGSDDAVDCICAHGTATPYNDDMESYAISRAGYEHTPVSGLKGYFGHTLGAAGVIESIISIMAMQNDLVIGTKGTVNQGVVAPVCVAKENIQKPVSGLLKLMSGFGGCNAAVYFKKHGE